MKPLIFGPKDRPHIQIKKNGPQSIGDCKVVEVGGDYLVLQGADSLPLRGSLVFEGEVYPFDKKDEQKVDDLYYTQLRLKPELSEDLYRKFLVRLPSEELSEWLIDQLPRNEGLSEASPIDEQHIDNGPIARFFERIILLLFNKPWISVLILLLISIFPASQIKNIQIDPSLDRILVKDSPEMKIYKNSLDLFGSDRSAILFIQDPNIFKPEKLKVLRKLAWDLQKWPNVDKVNSVFTSTFIRGHDETLYTEPLFQSIEKDSDALLKKVQDDPILHGRLIDVPKGILVITLQLDKNLKLMSGVAAKLDEKIAPLKKEFKVFYQTGEPVIELFSQKEMVFSPKIFLPLIALILFLGFTFFIKSIDAFVITMVGTVLSIFWSFGIMTYFDIPIQTMIILIPGITLTLSATEIVHLISSYKTGLRKGLNKSEALSFMSKDISKAIVLTFLSTSLGFLSILFSQIQILQEFAIVSFMALVFDFLVTILYLPLHIRVFSTKGSAEIPVKSDLKIFAKLKDVFYRFYLHSFFSPKALTILFILIVIHLWFGAKVRMDNDSSEMIAPYTQTKRDINYFKDNLGGMKGLHLVIESKESLVSPKGLKKIWEIHKEIKNVKDVEDVQSIAGVLALLNKEMISGKEKDYDIPKSKNLILQYMLTLSRDDVDPFLTPDKRKANIRLSHDVSSSIAAEKFIQKIESLVKRQISGESLTYYLTSRNILNINAGNTIIRSQVFSLITMVSVIIILMTFFFKSFKIGLLSLIPNLIPIIGLFGVMGMFDIPLNMGTCVVAAITIGIAADDTIHLFSRYFKDREEDLNPFSTASKSIHEELIPILTTSLTLSLSFSTFVISKIVPVVEFGLLSAYVLCLAVISDLYIGPWILTYFDLKSIRGRRNFFSYLIGPKALTANKDLNQLTYQELFTLFRCGKFKVLPLGVYTPIENELCILIKGDLLHHQEGNIVRKADTVVQENTLLFAVTKNSLDHLSPRIFKKLV